jgi:hypothetical protein
MIASRTFTVLMPDGQQQTVRYQGEPVTLDF